MAFMRATISRTKEFFLFSEELEEAIFMKHDNVSMVPVGIYDLDDVQEDDELQDCLEQIDEELDITTFEVVEQYWGNLSAPGYLDQTSYILGNTQAEVAQQLLDMYFDYDPEDMDADERDDMEWLQKLISDAGNT